METPQVRREKIKRGTAAPFQPHLLCFHRRSRSVLDNPTYVITEHSLFPLLVNLWVQQQQQQQQARPACYSYLNSLLYQNHTAGWMSQGFVLLRKAIQLTEGKKKKRHTDTALKDNKYLRGS